jgi:hypothetical protein
MTNDARFLFEAYNTVREQVAAPDMIGLMQKLKANPGDANKLINGIQSAIQGLNLNDAEKKVLLDGIKNVLGFKSVVGTANVVNNTIPAAPVVSSTGSYSTPITPQK